MDSGLQESSAQINHDPFASQASCCFHYVNYIVEYFLTKASRGPEKLTRQTPANSAAQYKRNGDNTYFIQELSQAHNLHHLVLGGIEIGSATILQWNLFHRHRFLYTKPPSHIGLVAVPRMPPGMCGALLDLELPDAKACLDTLAVDIV